MEKTTGANAITISKAPPSGLGFSEEIRFLFGKPPLIIGEDRKAYDDLLRCIAAVVRPEDPIAWMLIKDYVDLTFEIQRWRRAKAGIINVTRKEGLRSIFESVIETEDIPEDSTRANEAEMRADRWYRNSDSRAAARAHMERYDLLDISDTVTAQAIALRSRDLEILEGMIASAEARRSAALNQIEHHRQARARRIREAQDIIDVDSEEVPAVPADAQGDLVPHQAGMVEVEGQGP